MCLKFPPPPLQCCELVTLLDASFDHCSSTLLREGRGGKHKIVQISVFPIIFVTDCSGTEPGTPGLGIQCPNHKAILQLVKLQARACNFTKYNNPPLAGVKITIGHRTWPNVFAIRSVIDFPSFKLCPIILWTKNWKLFSSFLGFKIIYQRSRNNEPKRCLFTT